ncbi:MAG: 6-pyruvoyl-tetrahydropterin synthase-related protein [Patescibacteria group bacterium]|nr:6-pyruvoyl-tetrahydropterin synthase-related protein [Patescibacteria group bacterium]
MKIINKNLRLLLIGIFVSFVLSLPAIFPFFHKGYFPTHDGEWAVVRLSDMFRTLRDGQIPARFSGALNFGYGYPLFNFVYPFPYYLGVIVHSLRINFVDAIKFLFVVSVPISSFFMFLLGSKLWKNTISGIIASVIYVYFPYRMVDLYVRGSIGESLSFALFPIILYFGFLLIEKKHAVYFCILSLSIALIIGTHNIMTVLFLPLFIFLMTAKAVIDKRNENIQEIIASIFLGFGLASFFWIPAIFEKYNVLLSVIPIAQRNMNFINFSQLLFSPWGYGIPGGQNAFTYQLGWGQIIVILGGVLVMIRRKKSIEKSIFRFLCALLLIYLIYFLLLFKQSAFVWAVVPFLKEINYPWIVLSQLSLLASIIAGFIATQKGAFFYLSLFMIFVAFVTVFPYAKPLEYVNRGEDFYITNEATTTSSQELMPLWVRKMPNKRFEKKVEVISGSSEITNLFYKSNAINFDYNARTASVIRVNTIYYPGWKLFLGQNRKNITINKERGVMEFEVKPGLNHVRMIFSETPLRSVANYISMFSGLILLGSFITNLKIIRKKI